MVTLPAPLVRMFSNCTLPAAALPATRLTLPPPVLMLATVRPVPALKAIEPPPVWIVSLMFDQMMAPVEVLN